MRAFLNCLQEHWRLHLIYILLFTVAIAAYFRIGYKLIDGDTYQYFFGAVNIVQNQRYLIGENPPSFPMGFSILMAPFVFFFGEKAEIAGFACGLLGALAVVLLYIFTEYLFGKRAALFAATFLIFSKHWEMSTVIMSDVPALFFILLSLFSAVKYVKTKKPSFIYLFYFAAGWACLIRYASAVVFVIAGLYLVLSRNIHLLRKREVWLGSLLFILVLSPQLIHNHIYHGSAFKWGYPRGPLKLLNLSNFLISRSGIPRFGLGYLKQILLGFGTPILPFFIYGVVEEVRRKKWETFSIFLPWIFIPFIIFSLYSYFPDPRFIVPIFPALLMLSGQGFVKLFDALPIRKKLIKKTLAGLTFILFLISTAIFRYEKIQQREIKFDCRKNMLLWLDKNSVEDDILLSFWIGFDKYYAKHSLTGLPLSLEELEKIVTAAAKNVYFVFHEPWQVHDLGEELYNAKEWLEKTYGLSLLKTFEADLSLSPPIEFLHKIISKTGYYSSEEIARWSSVNDSWEVYSVVK